MKFAERMSRLGTESAFEVLARAQALERQGKSIIHLEVGEPDFATPGHITEAGIRALEEGHTHYSASAGILPLRQAIARHISTTRGVPVDPDEVIVTPGAKPIMFFAIMALIEPGDEVICPNPGYPIYESMVSFVGAKPVALPLEERVAFRFDGERLRRLVTDRTRMIVINSPHNPTGGILLKSDLEVVAELARQRNLWVLSDEIYDRIIYQGNFTSMLSLPGMKERTLLLNGYSKTYAMTGWRLGYGIMPQALAERITQLIINAVSCTATFTQMAGVAALEGPQDAVEQMVAEFSQRRDKIVAGLNDIPEISCLTPQGAFYVFPNITATGFSSKTLADYLLSEAGVAVLPGTAFGRLGEGYLRLSYANSLENIDKALERIRQALAAR